MRTFRCFLTVALSALVLFTGCKYDDDDLWDEVNKQAERIAALEAWQTTVNGNIGTLQQLVTALQDNDYVTGVTPFSTPAPGGYRITFAKSGEATIWNGAKGETGDTGATGATGAAGHSPVIAVKQHTDGKYYWTLDGQWLLADGEKVPVTGEKGDTGKSAYELAVENGYTGTLSEWLASLNGTNGVNGKSAYQQARDNGYTGTLTDWLASLQGINGTNGKSAYELAVESGYAGTLSEWLASLNGTNGVDGKSAYEQAVENGYTGTLTEWLESLQGATGATGANGATPKVAIGSDGYWYISANGSATGTPPAGTGWVSTGVKATGDTGPIGPQGPAGDIGPQGPQGIQGDAIFAANGVDNSNPDYVVFTLADGTTKINVPKYKAISISFTQPGLFTAGSTQTITYTNTGTTVPTDVRVVGVPSGWKISVNKTAKTFTITAPAEIVTDNFEGEATVLIADGDRVAAMYGLNVRAEGFYRVTDYYPDPCVVYENGTLVRGTPAIGVVFWLDPTDPHYDATTTPVARQGKIVSLDEPGHLRWGPASTTTNATDRDNGFYNMNIITGLPNWKTDYPGFAWVDGKNPEGTTYATATAGIWYLPAYNEVEWYQNKNTINPYLLSAGGTPAITDLYVLSTEQDQNYAWALAGGGPAQTPKTGGMFFRAICQF